MRLMLNLGDEGPTDQDLRDGDIFQVHPDTWMPGTEELKKFLIIEMPDYLNYNAELIKSELAIGSDGPTERHMRKYYVRYWQKLSPEELIAVQDPLVSVPVMAGRFGLFDIIRK